MGKCFGTVSFRQEINSIIEKKIASIDPGNVETIVVFDAIPLQFPKNFIKKFQHNQQRKSELCSTMFEKNVVAFCSKNTSE